MKPLYRWGILLMVLSLTLLPQPANAQNTCNSLVKNAKIVEFSSAYGSDFAPENLIDGDQNRSWSSTEQDSTPYIVIQLADAAEIERIRLNGYYQADDMAYQGDSIRAFRVEADVAGEWQTVLEADNLPLLDNLIDYPLETPVTTDQLKISFTQNHGGTAFEAAELDICGQVASGGKEPSGGKSNTKIEPLLVIEDSLEENTEDAWTFEAQENQVISIELKAFSSGTFFGLYSPSGERLKYEYAFDEYADQRYYEGILGYRILSAGTYKLIVKEGAGPYTLVVTEGYFGETIGSVKIGQTVENTMPKNGIDRWLIDLKSGDVLSIELASSSRGAFFAFYEPDGSRIKFEDTHTEYPDQLWYEGLFGLRIPLDGLYMIEVKDQTGFYQLSVSSGYFGQVLGNVAEGESVTGNIVEHGIDHWTATLTQGQNLRIILQTDANGSYLELMAPDGDKLAHQWAYEESGTGYRAVIEYRVLETGLYGLEVHDSQGVYSLSIATQ